MFLSLFLSLPHLAQPYTHLLLAYCLSPCPPHLSPISFSPLPPYLCSLLPFILNVYFFSFFLSNIYLNLACYISFLSYSQSIKIKDVCFFIRYFTIPPYLEKQHTAMTRNLFLEFSIVKLSFALLTALLQLGIESRAPGHTPGSHAARLPTSVCRYQAKCVNTHSNINNITKDLLTS